MGLHGVAQLVDALDGGVGGGVKADTVVGAGNVIVDRAGNSDDGNTIFGERQRAAEGAVATDGDDAVQTQQFAGVDGLFLPGFGHEFLAAGGVEHRAAAIDDVSDALFIQTDDVAVDQAVPAAADADDVNIHADGSTHDGTDGCVHAGGVAAAGQHADAPDGALFMLFHMYSTFSVGIRQKFQSYYTAFFPNVNRKTLEILCSLCYII